MFNKDENIITQVSNLKLLVSSKVDSIIKISIQYEKNIFSIYLPLPVTCLAEL